MKSNKSLSYLMMACAMVTVGSTIVASKLMAEMPIFIAAFLRFAIASPILGGLCWIGGKRLPKLAGRPWLALCAQAGLGSAGYAVLLIAGMGRTSAADASVIAGALPAVAALFSLLALCKRPSRRAMLSILLATLGVWLAASGEPAAPGVHHWLGNALVLAVIACEAVFLLLHKSIKTSIDPLVAAAAMSVLSMMFCAIPAWYQSVQALAPVWTTRGVGAALYYALVPTVIGFYLWYRGASTVSGAEASLLTAVYPIAGLLLSAAILDEVVQARHWFGIGLTVLGIVVGALGAAGKPATCA